MSREKGQGELEGSGESTLRAHAARGVLWTATSNWGDQLARFLTFAILSRLLDPEAFGLVALAWVFVGLTDLVAEQGLVDSLVQRKNLHTTHLDTAFWASIAFGLLLGAMLAALAVPISTALGQEALAPVLVVLSLVIPVGSSNLVQRAILTRNMAFRSLAQRTLISVAVGCVVGVGAALLGFGVWSLVAQRLSSQTTATLVLWRVSDWRPHFNFGYADFRELFGFGKHVVGFRLLNFFNANVDNLIVGSFLGATSLGFYTVGYRILRLVNQVTTNLIDKVAFPLYSRLQDEPKRFRRAYYKSASFSAFVAMPVYIGILVLAPEIVLVLFGPKWSPSVPVMQVLALLGMIRALNYMNSSALTALGKPSWRVVIVAITTVLNVVAFLVAVAYGIVAVAAAAVCVGYLVAPMSFWAVNRLVSIDVRAYWGHIKGPVLASILLTAVMFGLRYVLRDTNALVTLIVVSSVGVLVYMAAIRILARPLVVEARALVRDALPASNPKAARLLSRS